jgi:uncharacterized membrane protein YjjP (DUF1212 family)
MAELIPLPELDRNTSVRTVASSSFFGPGEGVTLQPSTYSRDGLHRDGVVRSRSKQSGGLGDTIANGTLTSVQITQEWDSMGRSNIEEVESLPDAGSGPAVLKYDDAGVPSQQQVDFSARYHILNTFPSYINQAFRALRRPQDQLGANVLPDDAKDRCFTKDDILLSEGTSGMIRRSKIAVAIMQLYLNSGAAIHRVDSSFEALAASFGLRNSTVFLLWNAFLISLRHPQTGEHLDTEIFRTPTGVNLGKLSAVNRLIIELPCMTIHEAENRITGIANRSPLYPDWAKNFVAIPIISLIFAPMFYNGDFWSGLYALPLGFVTGSLYALSDYANPLFSDMLEFFAGFINGFLARIITSYAGSQCFNAVAMAGCVWMIPGMPLTLAIMQLVAKDTSNGVARAISALLTVIVLGFSIGLGSGLAETIPYVREFVATSQAQKLQCQQVNAFWFFLLYPISAICHCIMLEAEYWQWPLIIPPAGLSFGIWYSLQEPPYNTSIPFTVVVFLAALVSGLCGFGYARLTNDSAFPIIYMAFQFIVPGGLALKTVLGSIQSDLVPGVGFAARLLQALIGCMIGTYLSQIIIWPGRVKRAEMYR